MDAVVSIGGEGEDRRWKWKGVELEGEGKGGDVKEREGNNVLPHLKRAVAAYGSLDIRKWPK